jgi:hypothetical protein
MSVSDYTGLDDAAELAQRLREHEADDMDHALDCESEAGRDNESRALFWRCYGAGVLVALVSSAVIFWPQIAAVLKEISK